MIARCRWAAAALAAAAPVSAAQDALVRAADVEPDVEVAVAVERMSGEAIYQHHPERKMVLASNVKLLTTAAALTALPADYRWHTEAWLDGAVLWLRGGGDPSLRRLGAERREERFLDALAAALQERGVTRLDQLVLDDRWFDDQGRHPLWPEEQWQSEYCAPVGALVVEGGCLALYSGPGGLRVEPELGAALAVTSRKIAGQPLAAWWGADRRQLIVQGDWQGPASARLAVADPWESFRLWFEEGLRRRGLPVPAARRPRPAEELPERELVLRFPSAWTLAEAVVVANKDSDNFVAEMLLKTLAAERGAGGSFAAGCLAVREQLATLGLDPDQFEPADGSGLARDPSRISNRASPRALCDLLRAMAHHPQGRVYFDSLPVGGKEGKLAQRFQEPIFQDGRVRAKTGWIRGASSLSGYLLAPDETVLVFSIVVNYDWDGSERTNNARFRKLQEEVLAGVLARWPES